MNNWMVAAVAVVCVVALVGGYVAMFWSGGGFRRAQAPKRNMRMTWKVVSLNGPLPEGLADKVKYGVVISTDEMLAQAQTMLLCPLINGVDDKTGTPLAMLPWHVEVEVKQDPDKHYAEIDFARKYVSTKIVLPVGHNEIDMDGRERGYLDEASRAAVSRKLAHWLPSFHGRY